jgi:hypothetical protein
MLMDLLKEPFSGILMMPFWEGLTYIQDLKG